ncbi:MAG: hypothetical protein ACE149_01515 [Armatimonadota bacterium]
MIERLQQIPRYYIYLLLAAVVIWQILLPIRLPIKPSAATRGVLAAIENVPDDKLIIISADWDASTQAETGPQTEAIIHACFQLHKRFALMSLGAPMGIKLANDIAERVAEQYGAKYGVDWCNWGYKYGYDNILIAMAKNIPKTMGTDFRRGPVARLPMMAGVKDISSIGLVIEITGLAAITEYWIGLIQGVYGTPFASAYTAVMAPGYYPFLDSKQMKGMLVGAKGAAEMELLVRRPGLGGAVMAAQSWAHVFIIALIVLGNVGYLLASASERRRR